MEVTTERFIRKPLYVNAVRITPQNFDAVAAWCQGEVQLEENQGAGTTKKYIKVRVHNPKNPRQTKAFIGDWLLYTDRGYKVYTNKAFRMAFDQVEGEEPTVEQVQARIEGVDEPQEPATAEEIRKGLPHAQDRTKGPKQPEPPEETELYEPTSPPPLVAETPGADMGEFGPVRPGDDLGTTPQGEPIEVVEATPEAIADVVNEQQPVMTEDQARQEMGLPPKGNDDTKPIGEGAAVEDSPSSPPVQPTPATVAPDPEETRLQVETDDEHKIKHEPVVPPEQEPSVAEQPPATAAAGKRVLSEEEQRQMGPDRVREMLKTGDVILAQDLAETT